MIVKIIKQQNGSAVIEWVEDSEIKRSIVPLSELKGNECEHPEWGLPYGIEWADFVDIEVTPQDIQSSLRNAGIWTVDDLLHRPREVQGAINAAYGAVLQNLLRNVKRQAVK